MQGGEGTTELARLVVDAIAKEPSDGITFAYNEDDDVQTKINKIAKNIYGAGKVVFRPAAMKALEQIEAWGMSSYPVCIAKTQYSFSDDSKLYGVPTNFTFTIQNLIVNAGAEMIVAVAGEIMRMPGLPRHPQAERIDVVNGRIEGLE
jgi:formate--tetrahydrofolate ligase